MRYSETEGKYEASDSGSGIGMAITFLLIGLGAGALLGMLYAPKPGKQMRRDLRRKYEDAFETFDDWKEQAREFAEGAMERGSELADDLRERVGPITRGIRR
jgi:gas vesicle protein